MTIRRGLLLLSTLAAGTPALAAPVDFGLQVQGRLGYGTNPYLAQDNDAGSLLGGIRLTPQLSTHTATSSTALSGYYDYTGYTRLYDHSDAFGGDLRHQQQFSAKWSGTAHVGYSDTLNALFSPTEIVDEATLGRRQRRLVGDFSLAYQPTARDQWTVQGNASRATYPGAVQGFGLSDYNEYGGSFGYMRQFSEQTRLGLQMGVDRLDSKLYADTTSFQPTILLEQKFNGAWKLTAHVSAIIQRVELGSYSSTSTTAGFGAKLCKEVPRYNLCVEGVRDTAPSGLGGLRTDTHGTASFNYRLTERSNLNLTGTYGRSNAGEFTDTPDQDYANAEASYNYSLNSRVSVGGSLSYLWRRYQEFGTAQGFAGSLTVTASFGRNS